LDKRYSSRSLSGRPLASTQSSRLTPPGLKLPILVSSASEKSSLPLSSWSSYKWRRRVSRRSTYSFERGTRFRSSSCTLAPIFARNNVARFWTCDLLTPTIRPVSRTVRLSICTAMNAARSWALPTEDISGSSRSAFSASWDFMGGRITQGEGKANTFFAVLMWKFGV
jgi:hypothetical protein